MGWAIPRNSKQLERIMKKFFIYAIIVGALAHSLLSAATPAVTGQSVRIEAALAAAGE